MGDLAKGIKSFKKGMSEENPSSEDNSKEDSNNNSEKN